MMSFQALLGFRSLFSGDTLQDTFANHLAQRPVPPLPQPADGRHRKRLGVGVPPVREADQVLRPDADLIYKEDPRETFKRHVWVSPFYEDELASLLQAAWATTASSWVRTSPTSKGLADPASYIKDLENFDYTPQQSRTVMRDNGIELSVRRPA